jgi:pimeloyl-ACP methyl ester carboxylesterase
MTTPQTRHSIDVPGARLAFDDEGHGSPILLIHSALINRRAWDDLVPPLLDAGYRVIRHDMRGFGESTAEDVEFSPRDDIRAVLDAAGVRQAAVVGNSMGGLHALDAVIETPDRFAALAWVCGGISGFEVPNTPEEDVIEAEMVAAQDAGDADAEAWVDVRLWVDGIGQPPTRVPAALRQAVFEADRLLVRSDHVFGRPIPIEPPANDRLGTVRTPTLVVLGGLDAPSAHASAARLAAAVPGARQATVPDVAHLVGMEAPDRLAALLVEFLAPLPRWA